MKPDRQVGREPERHYSAFGLTIASSIAIPGLLEASERSVAPFRVSFGPLSHSVDDGDSLDEGLAVRHDAHVCVMRFADGTAAEIDLQRRTIRVQPIDGATLEDNAGYLTGPVVAMLARLEGRVCLHGAVVAIDGKAHVICGPSETGKSTTAAAFVREGFSLMSDDIAAIDEKLRVHAASPRVQLWPGGAEMVFGGDHGLPPISPPWEKLYLDTRDRERFEHEPHEPGGVWILAKTDSVEELSGSRCLTTLVSNVYMNHLGTPDMRRREFGLATEICRTTPVRLLPAALDPLGRIDSIIRELRRTERDD